jgi:hypothetical protein
MRERKKMRSCSECQYYRGYHKCDQLESKRSKKFRASHCRMFSENKPIKLDESGLFEEDYLLKTKDKKVDDESERFE